MLYNQHIVNVVVIVFNKRYEVRWDVFGALAAVERLVKDSADNCVRCFFDYVFYDVQIRRNGKIFIVRLITFNLLDVRLSLACELPIRTF